MDTIRVTSLEWSPYSSLLLPKESLPSYGKKKKSPVIPLFPKDKCFSFHLSSKENLSLCLTRRSFPYILWPFYTPLQLAAQIGPTHKLWAQFAGNGHIRPQHLPHIVPHCLMCQSKTASKTTLNNKSIYQTSSKFHAPVMKLLFLLPFI